MLRVCVTCRVPVSDEVSEQTLVFSVSATFVFKDDQELKGYTPPPPPGLLTVPYDVFYPFIGTNSATPGQHRLSFTNLAIGMFVSFCSYFF